MFDFKNAVKLKDLSTVPDNYKGLYVKLGDDAGDDAGQYVIADFAKGAVETIMGQGTALVTSRREAKDAKGKADLSGLSKWGESVTEIAAKMDSIVDDFETRLADGDDAKINLDKYKAERDKGHAIEKEGWDKKYNALYFQLEETIVTKEAVTAIVAEGGNPKLLLPFVKARVKIANENGVLTPYIIDDAGDRRFSGTSGNDLTMIEYVAEMKLDPEYGQLFTSPKQEQDGGGGTPPNSTQVPAQKTGDLSKMSSQNKINAGIASLLK